MILLTSRFLLKDLRQLSLYFTIYIVPRHLTHDNSVIVFEYYFRSALRNDIIEEFGKIKIHNEQTNYSVRLKFFIDNHLLEIIVI